MNITLLVVAAIGVLLTVAGVLGIRAAWKVGQNTQTLTNYRDAAASWEAAANALRQELLDFKNISTLSLKNQQKALDDAMATIAALTVKVQVLEDTLTGRSAMIELAASIHNDIEALRAEIRGAA